MRQEGAGDGDDAAQIDGQDGVDLVVLQRFERLGGEEMPDIVDQHVDGPVERFGKGRHGGAVGDIDSMDIGHRAERRAGLGRAARVIFGDDKPGALFGEAVGYGAADAGTAAGDQHGLAGEIERVDHPGRYICAALPPSTGSATPVI